MSTELFFGGFFPGDYIPGELRGDPAAATVRAWLNSPVVKGLQALDDASLIEALLGVKGVGPKTIGALRHHAAKVKQALGL